MANRSNHPPVNGGARFSGPIPVLVNLSQGDLVRMQLQAKGHTFAGIARDLGVTRPAVSATVHGHFTSRRILAHVAALLGVPVESLQVRPLTPVSVARGRGPVNVGVSESPSQNQDPSVRRRRAA